MSRLTSHFGALAATLGLTFACCGARAVNGAGLGSGGNYRPPIGTSINLVCVGDSIIAGFTTSNAPATSWCNQAGLSIASDGYSVTTTNLGQPSSSSWEWTCPNGFNCPHSSYFAAGKSNVAIVAVGTNNFSGGNIFAGTWFHSIWYPLTGVTNAGMGPVSAVTSGSSTTITLGTGVTANRNNGEFVQVVGSGVTGLDGTCAAIIGKTGTTLTLNIATSGATSSTGTAYLCTGAGSGGLAIAYFSPTVAGNAGSSLPSWILAGGTTDGTITWGAAESQSQTLPNLEADIGTLATELAGDGFGVVVAQLLPRGTCGDAQTLANQETQRLAFNSWLSPRVGTGGIKAQASFGADPNMGQSIAQTANTTYYTDTVHPNDFGSNYLGVKYKQALYDAMRP